MAAAGGRSACLLPACDDDGDVGGCRRPPAAGRSSAGRSCLPHTSWPPSGTTAAAAAAHLAAAAAGKGVATAGEGVARRRRRRPATPAAPPESVPSAGIGRVAWGGCGGGDGEEGLRISLWVGVGGARRWGVEGGGIWVAEASSGRIEWTSPPRRAPRAEGEGSTSPSRLVTQRGKARRGERKGVFVVSCRDIFERWERGR